MNNVSSHQHVCKGSLIDHGANVGIAGKDVQVINKTGRQVDVQGIDNHQIVDIPIGTIAGVVPTQRGEIIAIMHQYALAGKVKTIHSTGQFQWYKHDVNDKCIKVGGLQCTKKFDGYMIPLDFKSGLP